MDITMKACEMMKKNPHMMNKDMTHRILDAQGDSHFMMMPGNFPEDNPMTTKGKKIMSSMKKQYVSKRGKQVFYASANKGKIKGVHK